MEYQFIEGGVRWIDDTKERENSSPILRSELESMVIHKENGKASFSLIGDWR